MRRGDPCSGVWADQTESSFCEWCSEDGLQVGNQMRTGRVWQMLGGTGPSEEPLDPGRLS